MNKNFKVIQIHGLSGLLILGVVVTGLFCGFVIFPVWVIMNAWNAIVGDILHGPVINYFQAVLLWSAVALMFYIGLKNSISIKIQKEDYPDPKDIKDIVSEINENKDFEEEIREKEETRR
ncbi:MAG: hypothetical protein ACD_20C00375G0003 [uncultured bacterium]|nr:MAG: hypothetical protein ACD_20C00375G0003 [uncultured bacterium]HBH17761.1 hypothetical protein [Cyanobacteria bacterium UBA9579]